MEEYARFAVTLRQLLQHPERLEGPAEAVSAVDPAEDGED